MGAALAEAALVTIVATGGAGKTRLAAEVVRRATAAGRPARVIELAGLRAPEEVLPTVLAALGGADTTTVGVGTRASTSGAQPRGTVTALAPDLDGLIVLDNCEHVLDTAAAVVADLVAVPPPEVAVLATSRAPLGLAGEAVHRLSVLPDADALALIESRARAGGAVPPGTPTGRSSCATGWTTCRSPSNWPPPGCGHAVDDVLAGLTDRFALLDAALRGLPERHASLWAMVDYGTACHPSHHPGDWGGAASLLLDGFLLAQDGS